MDAASQPRAWKVLLASPLFISSGARRFWRSGSECARCRRFCWLGCASWWLESFCTGGCAPGHCFSNCARVECGVVAGCADFCFRLRVAVLGGAACALGDRGGHDGDDSGVHGAGGDCVFANATFDVATGLALLVGMGGVAVLVGHTMSLGEVPVDTAGACALIVAAISWSVAASLSRKLPLPAAKAMSSGAQMLAGGVLLMLTAAVLGEFRGFHVQAVFARGMARVGVSDRGRINRGIYSVRLADSSRIADQGGNLCVCESGGRGAGGILPRRGSDRSAHDCGDAAGAGERGGDYDDTEEERGIVAGCRSEASSGVEKSEIS